MWFFWTSLILFIALRGYPYLSTSVPLGYDAGLYLYLFKKYNQLPIWAYRELSGWAASQFPLGIAFIGRLFTSFIPPERLLVPLVIAFSILLFVSVYILARRLWGKREAVWAVFILTASAIQYHTYWYYYAKQIFGSSLLLFTIYFLIGSSWWAVPLAVLISYTHEPTFIVLISALIAGFIMEKSKRPYYATVSAVTAIFTALYYLPRYAVTVRQYVAPVVSSLIPPQMGGAMGVSSGTFYDLLPALFLALPYLPFGVLGVLGQWHDKKTAPLLGALIGSCVIIVFGLFLWRRFIIYADLFVILYAGYGIAHLIEKYKKPRLILRLLSVYALILVAFIGMYVYKTGHPEIFDDELKEIKLLAQTEPDAYVLVTDQEYMPYVYGWSDRKVIAPGYGEYDIYWTIPQWREFWGSNSREKEKQLLLLLPKPLYIYRGDRTTPITTGFSGPCFTRINWRTYQFVCTNGF